MSSSVVDSSVMRVNASMGAHGAGKMLCTGHTIEFQCYFTTAARPNTPRSNGAGQSEDVDEASAEDRAFKTIFKGSGSKYVCCEHLEFCGQGSKNWLRSARSAIQEAGYVMVCLCLYTLAGK